MTPLMLHNSATRQKEPFTPLDPSNVRMYVCGPTVYDRAHLGNARPVVVFDILYRLLMDEYGAAAVHYARNLTDIDDKIIARATLLHETVETVADRAIAWFHEDMWNLGAAKPTFEPRATDFIQPMQDMIARLIARDHAYVSRGHVLFSVQTAPRYGAFSGRTTADMIAGARVEVAPYKKSPMDFVLWKPSDASQPGWDSPWGRGRPGWHIECSAMATTLLGADFDIHAGGADLMFPHHENEIAQSTMANPGSVFARYWLHNEMVQVNGKKMAKSLDNFTTVASLLGGGWTGDEIRLALLMTHYRKPVDISFERLREARKKLRKWQTAAQGFTGKRADGFMVALRNDINTPGAFAEIDRCARESPEQVVWALDFMGVRALASA